MQHARLAAFWTGAGVLATLAVLPYVFAIDPSLLAQLPMPLALVVVAQTAQTGILLRKQAGVNCEDVGKNRQRCQDSGSGPESSQPTVLHGSLCFGQARRRELKDFRIISPLYSSK